MTAIATADQEALVRRADDFIDAFNARDAAALAALFADDANFVNIFGAWMRGRVAIAAGHAQGFASVLSASRLERLEHQLTALGPDLALCHLRWQRHAVGDSPLAPAQGVLSLLLERRSGGWVLLSGHNTQTTRPPGQG